MDNEQKQREVLQRAFLRLQTLKQQNLELKKSASSRQKIAIIGMSCRLPGGVRDPESFWQLMQSGRDCIGPAPAHRWSTSFEQGKDKWEGAFLDKIDQFDPEFFIISPREAAEMDPQQRMLLELSYHTLEHGGQAVEKLKGQSVGVFIGTSSDDYQRYTLFSGDLQQINAYNSLGTARSVAAGRIAYSFGLHGPAVQHDTACSSSLYSVHAACQSLLLGECQMALAGGINLMLSPETFQSRVQIQALSPSGRCRTFSADADGYARGEGGGMVLLKPLAKAVEDGDRIFAVIHATVCNHDGRSNGLTAPNGEAQKQLIRAALEQAGVAAEDIQYIETHGTGTKLGDPIEVNALGEVLATNRGQDNPLYLGALKSQIGHLEAAAGIAGLIKSVLCLQYKSIPANLHFSKPNPLICWQKYPITAVNKELPWPESKRGRYAGVSAFGLSGTNVHVIVGDYQEEQADACRNSTDGTNAWQLLPISAKSNESLQELGKAIEKQLEAKPMLEDYCYNASCRRSHFERRVAFVFNSHDSLQSQLTNISNISVERKPHVRQHNVWMFTDQDGLAPPTGWRLYTQYPTFRETLDSCAELLMQDGIDLLAFLQGNEKPLPAQVEYLPLVQFSLQYSMAHFWSRLGCEPAVLFGQGLGEYVAACFARVFSLEDALRLLRARARLMEPVSAMIESLYVDVGAEQCREWLNQLQTIGAKPEIAIEVNHHSTVITGCKPAMESLKALLERIHVRKEPYLASILQIPLMESMLDEYERTLRQLEFNAARIPLLSSVTAQYETDSLGQVEYWLQHVRQPALFAQCIDQLQRANPHSILEIGPIDRLASLARQCWNDEHRPEWISSLQEGQPEEKSWLDAVAQVYILGTDINWSLLYPRSKYQIQNLPLYPFEKQRYWSSCTPYYRVQIHLADVGVRNNADTACENATSVPDNAKKLANQKGQNRRERELKFLKKCWVLDETPFSRSPYDDDQIPKESADKKVLILATPETQNIALAINRYISNTCIITSNSSGNGFELPSSNTDWSAFSGLIDLVGCGTADTTSLSWWHWLQRMVESAGHQNRMMLCVTNGLESFDNENTNLAGASRVGLYRMLHSEYSSLRSRHLDVAAFSEIDLIAKTIATEFFYPGDDTEVCYRAGRRYRAYLNEVIIPSFEQRKLRFSQAHVLWITGGTRGIGYLCAKHFVEKYGVKRLLLTGKEALPDRAFWQDYAHLNHPMAEKIRAILRLESQGVEVRVAAVPLHDARAVETLVKETKETFGPIAGLIHCAGVVDFKNPALIRKTISDVSSVLEPKVKGLQTLYNSLRNEPLQVFVLFSSVSAIIPSLGAGHSDYAMANAYMDYFAEAHRQQCPIVSIQWPNWKDTGFGEVKSIAYKKTGLLSQTDAEGLRMLDDVLGGTVEPVIMPAVVKPENWQPYCLMQRALSTLLEASENYTFEKQIDASTDSSDLRKLAENWLTGLFAQELNMASERMSALVPFQEYGVDSILLVQIISKIDSQLNNGARLDPAVILENPTIEALAENLLQQQRTALVKMFAVQNTSPGVVATERSGSESSTVDITKHANVVAQFKLSDSTCRERAIAIVGIACHFPDADNTEQFWENLKAGRESISEIPLSRWDKRKHYSSQGYKDKKSISKWGGFLPQIEYFDPGFFSIPAMLAPQIDPLERQWLEVSTEALADAGYDRKAMWGRKVGVFAGSRVSNFASKLDHLEKDIIVGVGQNFIAAHLAHIFNFKGPNMVVDTACASSLTAVHLAVQSIRCGESEIALAGGVDILLDERPYLTLSAAQVLSPDGRCKTFDESANGIGLGEGCGVLVLKPLHQAIADGNKIYGVIDGSAINNDGNTMGITTPNPEAQRELIETAIADANIDPSTISYIETHGTGTLIGDPLELKGLSAVFKTHTHHRQFCGVGSVKTNIGHLLSAAGAASLIKVLLALSQRELPPTLNCKTPNPRFKFQESPLYIVDKLQCWQPQRSVLRAGISAFGLGGNNAHIIVSNEGVPENLRAGFEARGPTVVFNRGYYWPDPKPEHRDVTDRINIQKPVSFLNDEDNVFAGFFQDEQVAGGNY